MNTNNELLHHLKPRTKCRVLDVVKKAGVNVDAWGVRRDGSIIDNPKANQSKNHEWGFGGDGDPVVICIWHDELELENNQIVYTHNLRKLAIDLEGAALIPTNSQEIKSRARKQAQSARNVDRLLQEVLRNKLPLRIVLLNGHSNGQDELGLRRATPDFRELDDTPWFMHEYSEDGSVRLVREIPSIVAADTVVSSNETVFAKFEDQFSIKKPQSVEVNGRVFVRSEDVRAQVLKRANGGCELCKQKGFQTESGRLYLETHHVVPLSESGADEIWNVAALCPQDHRRAHFAVGKGMIQSGLKDYLCLQYPQYVSLIRGVQAVSGATKT